MAEPGGRTARTRSRGGTAPRSAAGTLTAPAAAGDTNVSVSSVANYYLGGTINIDTGDGGERLESRTITAIGTAPASTSLALPAAAGDTNVKLNSVTGMAVGGKLQHRLGDGDDHPGRDRRDQHHAGGRHDRRRGAAPAAHASGRELDLERRGPLERDAGRHDLHAQDLHRRPGEHHARHAADQRRRLARHLRQRPAGRAVRRRQQRLADLADRRHQAAARRRART